MVEVATDGGRQRWRTENEGFNTQKNSGLNLEHAYSHTCWAAYYFLLQIAHLLLQLVEKGSLLRQLAQEQGKRTAVELFGSLKNMAQRLLESLRYWTLAGRRPSTRQQPARSRSGWTAVSPPSGGWVCSRLGPVALGLVADRTRSRPSSPFPSGLFRPRSAASPLPPARRPPEVPISQGC